MEKEIKVATFIANMLDNSFHIGGMRFGLSAVFDLVPEVGDFIVVALSLYLVFLAIRLHVPLYEVAIMLFNILLNFLIGLIPIIGDAAYILNKANLKNLAILKRYAKTGHS